MDQQDSPQYVTYTTPVLPTSTLALASLILGIGGFTFLPLIGSIAALVTGYAARKETRAVPPAASGDGLATAGIVLGWVQLGLGAVAICCFAAYMVFFFGLFGSSLQGGH